MTTVSLDAAGRTVLLDVDPADHIGRVITRSRTWYEHGLLTDAARRVTAPGTAIDVGAHIGNHALWFAAVMGLNVVAIEPNPDSYARLAVNIAANRVDARLIAGAAGRAEGWASVHPPAIEGNSGTCTVSFDGGPVPVFALDELGLTDVRLIKIDVEGTATTVLAGAQRLLSEQSPVLYVEGDADEIAAALPAGYECFGEFAKTPTWGFSR